MSAGDCSALNAAASANTGIQGALTPSVAFDDYVNSKNGTGCQISLITTRDVISNFTGLSEPVEDAMENLGWQQDSRYGAAGVGGYQIAYAKGKNLCFMMVSTEPSDPSLCPLNSGEPITVCWSKLPPEQMLVSVTLNCAQANFP